MDVYELFERLGLALAIGFLVGVERGWRERGGAEGSRTAGLRTFALTGLLGGVSALIGRELGGIAFGTILIVFVGAFAAFKWREAEDERDYSVTTVVAAMLVFVLGAYATYGDMAVAAAAGVVTAALLAFKGVLHAWLKALTWPEIRSAVVLLAMTFLALPILPDRGFGPFQALNPYEIWLMAVLIAGVSFAGYVVIRVVGEERGVIIAGAAGGLVASTAVTLDLGRRSKREPDKARLFAGGALIAGAVMFLRILALASIVDLALLRYLAAPLGVAALVCGGLGVALARAGPRSAGDGSLDLGNPFELPVALRFAAILGLVMLLAAALRAWFGPQSLVWLAAAAGLADVDAVTLSTARAAGGEVSMATAVTAIVVVGASNSLSKAVMSAIAGTRAFAMRFGAGTAAALAAAFAVLWATGLPPG